VQYILTHSLARVVKVLEIFLGNFRGGLAKGALKPEQIKKKSTLRQHLKNRVIPKNYL
jgi:hypothetical protein